MGGCQNYRSFLGTLNIRCRTIFGTQKGTIILTTTQVVQTIKQFPYSTVTVPNMLRGISTRIPRGVYKAQGSGPSGCIRTSSLVCGLRHCQVASFDDLHDRPDLGCWSCSSTCDTLSSTSVTLLRFILSVHAIQKCVFEVAAGLRQPS